MLGLNEDHPIISILSGGYRVEHNGITKDYPLRATQDPHFAQTIAKDFNVDPCQIVIGELNAESLVRSPPRDDWLEGASDHCDLIETREKTAAVLSSDASYRDRYHMVAQIVYQYLAVNGAFYYNAQARLAYWFDEKDKTLFPLDSELFLAHLSTKLNINRQDAAFKWLQSDVYDHCIQYAPKVFPRKISYYDKDAGLLYYNHKQGRVYVLDGETIREADNGEGGVLFLWDDFWEPVDPIFNGPPVWNPLVLNWLSLDEEESGFTADEVRPLTWKWIEGFNFRSIISDRPISAHLGEPGSGKTTIPQLIGWAMFGSHYDVAGLQHDRQDAAVALVTNNPLPTFDNADARLPWMPDLLAQCSTGQTISLRQLYTTNKESRYPVDTWLQITARMAQWARLDVIDRLFIYRHKRLETYVSRDTLKHNVLASRPQLVGELLTRLNASLKRLKESGEADSNAGSMFRLRAFSDYALRSSEEAERPALSSILAKMTRLQERLGAEQEEDIVEPLKRWIEGHFLNGRGLDLWKQWTPDKTSTELYKELSAIAKADGFNWTVRSPPALGKRLALSRIALRAANIAFRRGRNRTWSFQLVSNETTLANQPSQPSQPSQPPHTYVTHDTLEREKLDRNSLTSQIGSVPRFDADNAQVERIDLELIRSFLLETAFPNEEVLVGYSTAEKIRHRVSGRFGETAASLVPRILKGLSEDKLIIEAPFRNCWKRTSPSPSQAGRTQ